MSLIKCYYNIVKPENFENYHGYLSLHQSTRAKHFKIGQNVKTSFGMNSIVRQCVQKRNTLLQYLWLARKGEIIKETFD